MYYVAEVRDTIRVEPNRFGENLDEVVLEICRETFEGTISKELGFTVVVMDLEEIGPGRLVPGDGAAFYDVKFTTLNYLPEDREFVIGDVVEVTDFGVFLRLGCVDALCHVSQVSDDFFSYNSQEGALMGRDSKKRISVGDRVRARIILVTIGKSQVRVGVTMRQAGLGVESWVEEWREQSSDIKKKTDDKKKSTDKKKTDDKKKSTDKKKSDDKKKSKDKKSSSKSTKKKTTATKKKPEKPKVKVDSEIEVTYKDRTYTFEKNITMGDLKDKRGVPNEVKDAAAEVRGWKTWEKLS